MASEQAREHDPLAPLREGDFHRINGIGPGIEQRLHAAGVNTFSHLASLEAEEICTLLNGLVGMTVERITRQDWPGQAHHFADELANARLPAAAEKPGPRQHYASFMVELLLEEDHTVRRTRVIQVQSGEKEGWAGWESERLLQWITAQAGITTLPAPAAEEALTVPRVLQEPLQGKGTVEMISPGAQTSSPFFSAGNPFTLDFTLDTLKVKPSIAAPLLYQASVEARRVGSSKVERIGETFGACAEDELTNLSIPIQGLVDGTYRLHTTALVYPASAEVPEKEGLYAFYESGLIHVYTQEGEFA